VVLHRSRRAGGGMTRLRKFVRALLRPLERTMAAGPVIRIGSAAIPLSHFDAGVLAPPGPHKPGASGSNPGPAITPSRFREDQQADDSHERSWPIEEEL
jgi:hypothetical protein